MISRSAGVTPLSPKATHPKYRPDIDGLRAIAVLCVLLFHAFPAWLPGGFIGVDVFFVISGYLISTIILKSLATQQFSIWHFYARRIRRLFPVLLVVLLATLAAGWWLLPALEYSSVAKHTVGGAAFVANLMLAADSGYFSDVSDSNPLLHLWSLGIEEQFYLLWPLLLWLFYTRRWPLWLGIGLCLAGSFAYSVYLTGANPKLAFYLPFTRFWELIVGALWAWLSLQPAVMARVAALPRGLLHGLSVAALALLALTLYKLNPGSAFPGWRAALPVLVALAFIMAGPYALINRYLLSHPLMVWLGLISYPLYLWHWPLLAYFHGASYAMPAAWHTAVAWALLGLSVLLAWLSYRYVETPLRGGAHGRPKLIGLMSAMLLLTALAGWIWAAQGLPSRGPQGLQQILASKLRTPAWTATLRDGICHNIIYTQPENLNAEVCLPTQRPSVVLWGDSHAASLYSAFSHWGEEHGIAIGQITTDATAPYLSTEQKNNMGRSYEQMAWPVINKLKDHPPTLLVLHAFWVAHSSDSAEFLQPLLDNIVALLAKELPTTQLLILGAVPNWDTEIQPNLANYARLHAGELIPPFTTFGLSPSAQALNAALGSHWATDPTVHYLSPTDYLCKPDAGCLFRLPKRELAIENLAYVDSAHLNTRAAHWLVQQLSPQLLRWVE